MSPLSPLCGDGAVFTLTNNPGKGLLVRRLGSGGEGGSGRGGDSGEARATGEGEAGAPRCASARTARPEREDNAALEPAPEPRQAPMRAAPTEAVGADGGGAVEVECALPPRPRPAAQTMWAASAAADLGATHHRYAIS